MIVAVSVLPPPVAVMVMVEFPVGALLPALIVMVEVPDPGDAMEEGLKLTVFELPWPDTDNEIAEAKVLEAAVLSVTVPEAPCATWRVAGVAERAKVAGTGTTSDTVAVWVRPSPLAVRVTV